jgi:uncharacterized protein YeaC (DUF1315 family)
MRGSLPERFWSHVHKSGPLPSAEAIAVWPEIKDERCWIYGKDIAKRSRVWVSGRSFGASQVVWFLETGKWPEHWVLHKCDRGGCVRPSHLFEGTGKDNAADMIAKKRDRVVGERHSEAKLTWEQVAEIRRLGAPWVRHHRKGGGRALRGTATLLRQIARRYGCHVNTIKDILLGKTWNEE